MSGRIRGMAPADYALAVVVAQCRGDLAGVDVLLRGLTARQMAALTRALVVVVAVTAKDAADREGVDMESFVTGMASVIGEGER